MITDNTIVKWLPLMMGDKLIGRINLDKDTGEISGKLIDPEITDLLNEYFGDNLLEVSFFGKPTNPSFENISQLNAKLRTVLKGSS
jgi:hypothetical protein